MADPERVVLRRRLDHPDIEIKRIRQDERGPLAHILVDATEEETRRMLHPKLDVEGEFVVDERGVHVSVRPDG